MMPPRWEQRLHRLRDAPVPLARVRNRANEPPRPGSPMPSPRDRIVAAVVAFAAFVGVVAFAWRAFSTSDESVAIAPPPLTASSYSLWLSAERVPPGPVELAAVLVNHDGTEAIFGVHAKVDRWNGHEWVPFGELVMCMDHWHCTARIQPPREIDAVPGLGLGAEPGNPGPVERFTTDGLEPGWYRISQEANEGVVAATIVEIAEGASSPAPLVPVDAPAISVSPALVSPDGAEIHLYPLIPPRPDGSLSREDVLDATRGLSDVARIERWDGSSWVPEGEVELRETDADLTLRANVPALTGGEYRLVRDGPSGPHAGRFWVK
jgi:hypothetical protein